MTDRRVLLIAAEVDRSLVDAARGDGRFDVRVQPAKSEDELVSLIADAEIVVTRAFNRITRRVIEAAPRLKVIAQGTSGIDNIDEADARERGITIISLPGGNANAVAELVIGCILSLTRTVPFYTREVASGRWSRDDCATRHEMRYHGLGLVGLGHVGRRVAHLAQAFGMTVTAVDPYITDADFTERGAIRADTLDDILAGNDIVSLHVPLTDETRKMIGDEELRRMRRGSILISMARGEVIDQHAALRALASNHLAGLAMDVYDPEPPAAGFPDDPRLILTPHIAGCTHECKSEIGAALWEKIAALYH